MSAGDRPRKALLKDIVHESLFAYSASNKLPEGGLVLQKSLNDLVDSCLSHYKPLLLRIRLKDAPDDGDHIFRRHIHPIDFDIPVQQ